MVTRQPATQTNNRDGSKSRQKNMRLSSNLLTPYREQLRPTRIVVAYSARGKCWFARHLVARTCIHRTFGSQMSCLSLVLRLYFFVVVFYVFIEAEALRSTVLRCAGAPTVTRVSSFFSFCLFGYVTFSEYFWTMAVFSLCGQCVLCVFFPFILDIRLVDAPAGVTQDFSSTFLLRCLPLFFITRRIQRSFSRRP